VNYWCLQQRCGSPFCVPNVTIHQRLYTNHHIIWGTFLCLKTVMIVMIVMMWWLVHIRNWRTWLAQLNYCKLQKGNCTRLCRIYKTGSHMWHKCGGALSLTFFLRNFLQFSQRLSIGSRAFCCIFEQYFWDYCSESVAPKLVCVWGGALEHSQHWWIRSRQLQPLSLGGRRDGGRMNSQYYRRAEDITGWKLYSPALLARSPPPYVR